MKRTWILLFVAVMLCCGGIYLSDQLLAKHMHIPGMRSWVEEVCESSASPAISCDAVLASRWGVFPPIREGDPQNKNRLPMAFIGMAYFTALLVWFLAVGRANQAGRRWHLLPLLLNACGLAGSIGFVKVMAFDLQQWCPLCVATHVMNLLLFIVNVMLWPRKRAPAPISPEETAPAPAGPYPGMRLAVVVMVLAFMLALLELQLVSVKALKLVNRQLSGVIQEVQGSVNSMIALHLGGDRRDLHLRPDDPIRHDADGAPTVVVWADFECRACRKFADDFENIYFDSFGGGVRTVFKHYPLSSDCNPHVHRRTHPRACDAARLAEAVRVVGGNDKFWEAHDILFASRDSLRTLGARGLAERLDLDPEALAAAMDSDEVRRRIAEDIDQAHALGVKSTPAVYLNGRPVNSWTRVVHAFWQTLGAKYQLQHAMSRPPAPEKPE